MADLQLHPTSLAPATVSPRWVRRALAQAAAATCVGGMALLTTGTAWALALGPVRVHSALGQPLRAEIALSQTTPAELDSLMVRVAAPGVFRAHGLDFGPTAAAVQAQLQRRGDAAFITLSTVAPVDDLFVDLVLETDWAGGSFARSYTLLLDPPPEQRTAPEVITTPAVPAAAAPQPLPTPQPIVPPVAAQPTSPVPATQAANQPAPRPAAQPTPAPTAAQTPSTPKATSGRGSKATAAAAAAPLSDRRPANVTVQRGDTLGEIVRKRRPRGVSTDQMLVAVLQANPDAFLDGNMNLLRTGAVLKMPSAAEAAAITPVAAREMVLAQSRDFNALRRGLATHAPRARVNAAERTSAGRVQSSVNTTAAPTAPADKLTLSKADPKATASQSASTQSPAPEDRLAAQKQALSNQDRLQQLQRNLEELQGISVSAPPSKAPARAQASAGTPTPAATPVTTAAPAQAAAPATPALATPAAAVVPTAPATSTATAAAAPTVETPITTPTLPATPATAPAITPAPAAAPVDPAATPAASQPAADQAAAAKPAMQKPDDSISVRPADAPKQQAAADGKKDDSSLLARLALPVGAASATILVGLLGWLAWQRRKGRADAPILDAAAAASAAPPPAPDANDPALTPLEQADAHLALGQIPQAIDVLQKALQRDPHDQPVLWKLAQIQAQQHDLAGLETSARALLEASAGQGPAWEAVLAIGQNVDPTNPFYNAAAQAAAPSSFADALTAVPEPAAAAAPAPQSAPQPTPQPAAAPEPEPLSADPFDLDLDLPAADDVPAAALPAEPMPGLDLDLDLDSEPAAAEIAPEPAPEEDEDRPEDPSLATKLDLAREFHSFGDTEGARALIDEVLAGAKKSGETYARALQMQAELL